MAESARPKVAERIAGMLSVFDWVVGVYEQNAETIRVAEGETQDLLHEIELAPARAAHQGYRFYRELKDIRERRRQAKDENEVLEEFYQLAKAQTDLRKRLQQIMGNAVRISEKLERRNYVPRAREDLTVTDTPPANGNKPFKKLLRGFQQETRDRRKHKHL